MEYPYLAGDASQTPPALKQPFVGDLPIATDSGVVATAAVVQYQVVALMPDETLIPFVTGTHTVNQAVITAIAGGVGKRVPYYTAGHFNHAALTWPAGTALDTLVERKQFFNGGTIKVGHVNP